MHANPWVSKGSEYLDEYLGKIRAATLIDLAAGINWPRYNVELYVSNLFDKRNELTRFVACSRIDPVLGSPWRT